MNKILTLLFAACLSIACSGGDDPLQPESTPGIKFNTETPPAPTFTAEGGSNNISFTAIESWSVTIQNTKSDNWCSVEPTSGMAGNATIKVTTKANNTPNNRYATITIKCGTTAQTFTVSQKPKSIQEVLAIEKEALITLYKALNGDNWKDNTNWCSDKPFKEWHGVRANEAGCVTSIELASNNLVGTVPTSLANLLYLEKLQLGGNKISGEFPTFLGDLPKLKSLDLCACEFSGEMPASMVNLMNIPDLFIHANKFSGKLPAEIAAHPRWGELWFSMIGQGDPMCGDPTIDLNGVFIPAPTFKTKDINGNELSSEQLYKENKYTIFFEWSTGDTWSKTVTEIFKTYYNSYKEKSIDIIGWYNPEMYSTEEQIENFLANTVTPWRNFEIGFYLYKNVLHVPGIFIVDDKGQVVFQDLTVDRDKMLADFHNSVGITKPKIYESTDYSKDGEVHTIQKATKGKGINIILMGDAYSDRLIADGTYEKDIVRAVKYLFDVEPYTTFRDLFNIYYVTVVSKNEIHNQETAFMTYSENNASTYIDGDKDNCLEYAKLAISKDQLDEVMIVVIVNSIRDKGTCFMNFPKIKTDYSSGPTISFFAKGLSDQSFKEVLQHEANGHGFAKLADEYAYEGWGHIPEEEKNYVIDNHQSQGWYKNIDFTSDLSLIKWAHFINDTRYANEGLGAFEGGLAYWSGVWRPTENSIMRYNVGGFNAPSREAIYYRMHKLAYGDEWQYDYEEFVKYDEINMKTGTKSEAPYYLTAPRAYEHCPPVIVRKSWLESIK